MTKAMTKAAAKEAPKEMVRTHVVLPRELLAQIDALAGERKRSEYIATVLAAKIKLDRALAAADAFAGYLKDKDTPGWNTPEETLEWVRASRRLDLERFNRVWGIE